MIELLGRSIISKNALRPLYILLPRECPDRSVHFIPESLAPALNTKPPLLQTYSSEP
jgi:hypothetical protein